MNAILLSLALLGQFRSSDLMMAGPARSNAADLMMAGEVAAVTAKRPLHFYGPTWCPVCPAALEVVKKELGAEFDIKVHKDYDTYPAWVIAQGRKSGWGYPMVHWTTNADVGTIMVWSGVEAFRKADGKPKKATAVTGIESAAAPTPMAEVVRVLSLLPTPQVGFVDWGCGDGRWLFAAAELWPEARITGVEIDPSRAAATRERVREAGLSGRIAVITGDATTTDVDADVGVAYLWPETLAAMKPRIERLRVFASFQHQPPRLPVVKNGDSWFYTAQTVQQSKSAVWGGVQYNGPVCNSPGCVMCRSIRNQLNSTGITPPPGSIWWSLIKD